MAVMSSDPNKKSARTFQCRDVLWETFEQMARELECSVDYLINEAMKQYARQRSYGSRTPFPGREAAGSSGMPGNAPQHGGFVGHTSQPPLAGPTGRMPSNAPHMSANPTGRLPPPPMRTGSNLPAPPPPSRQGHMQGALAPPAYPTRQTHTSGMPGAPPRSVPPQAPRSAPPPLPRQPGPGMGGGMGMPGMGMGGGAMPGMNGFPQPMGATLSVIYQGDKLPITKDRFVIGRGKQSSDLTLKDPNVSRQHAMIEFQNGVYFMVDMGSTNGVEYNGQRIARKQIAEGDVFRICDHDLRFTYR
jgi:neural Wiskott-Aldrich syndrome protein